MIESLVVEDKELGNRSVQVMDKLPLGVVWGSEHN